MIYRLSWKESELQIDNEEGTTTTIEHDRETEAEIRIERFVPPELSVTVSAAAERVRMGDTFTVTYTIVNDTKFDMSGLKLYDPEQSMQSIGLPSAELFAGESLSVEVTYTMGREDMSFSPVIEYTVRQREQTTRSETKLTVVSIVVDLVIQVEDQSATSEGTTFLVMVCNDGNHTVTNIQLYDEINTPIEEPFDLAPDQGKVLKYTVPSAISSETIRKVRFHVEATDALDTLFTVTDPNQYEVIPIVNDDSVKISLYVVLQRAFYDENGKLCGSIQFEIRNYSSVKLRNARLTELNLFGDLSSYAELQNGETWAVKSLQLDGVPELTFQVSATDPAGKKCTSETVRLDLSQLKQLADQTNDPVYVYPNNPYLKDLDVKYRGILRVAALIVLIISIACAIVCIVLYAVERNLKAKLPPEFEENMENALRKTNRRIEPQIFGDAPTEQFGYTVPVKLRDYGELTEQEAAARKKEYAEKLSENLREYRSSPAAISKTREPEEPKEADIAFAGTRIIPVSRPRQETVREDIKLISVNPVEPEPKQNAQKTKEKRVKEKPQRQPKPVERKPEKSTAAEPKPVEQKPEKPTVPESKPVERKPEKPTAPDPKPPVLIPQKETPVRTEPKPIERPAENLRQAATDTEPVKLRESSFKPQPGIPETRFPAEPPRMLTAIEKPEKRPVGEHTVRRMNG